MSQKANRKEMEILMKDMDQFFQRVEKMSREINEMKKRQHGREPKKRDRPRERLEERKSTQNDFSFLRPYSKPKSVDSTQTKQSKLDVAFQEFKEGNAVLEAMIKKMGKGKLKSDSVVLKTVKSESVFHELKEEIPMVKSMITEEVGKGKQKSVSVIQEGEKTDCVLPIFPIEKTVQQEKEKTVPELSNVSSMEENVQEAEQQNSDCSEDLPKEENVQEEEQQDSEFSDISSMEQNVPGEEKQFSDVFPLKQNIMVSEEVVDFILPISIVPTNHALDLRTNLFQEEENDTSLTSTTINSTRVRIVEVAKVKTMKDEDEFNKMDSNFDGQINAWQAIELSYAKWGIFKVMGRIEIKFK